MSHVLWGVIALVVGLAFCFRGYLAMRTVIALWGVLVGFSIGATVGALVTGEPLLSGPIGWVAAALGALLLGWLAYAFYAVAVILVMGSVGFALGSAAAGFFNPPDWVVWLAGIVGAVLLVGIAMATNMPDILLILVAASGGASAAVAGIALIMGMVSATAVLPDALATVLSQHLWLNLVYFSLFVAGVFTQMQRRNAANLRAVYN